MTRVADDKELGKFARQQHDLFERVRKGSLPIKKAFRMHKQLLGSQIVTIDATEDISQLWAKAVKDCGCDSVYINPEFNPAKHLLPLGFTGQQDIETNLRKQDETTTTEEWLGLLDDNEASKDRFVHPLFALLRAIKDPDEQRENPVFVVWRDSTGQLWYLILHEDDGKRGLDVDRGGLIVLWYDDYRAVVSAK